MNHRNSPTATSDQVLAESTTVVPTRLGHLHVRSVGQGTPTVLWPSMFVDSHTWDPLVPLLPAGRRYLLVDPARAGPERGPAPRQRHRWRRGRGHRPARRARHRRPGRLARQRVRWARRLQARCAPRRAPKPRGRQLTGPAGSRRAAQADRSPAAGPADRGADRARALRDPHGDAHRRLRGSRTDPSGRRRVVGAPEPPQHGPGGAVVHPQPGRRECRARAPHRAGLFVASDDRGDWSPQDAQAAAALAPDAEAVTVDAARTLIPLEQPEKLALLVRRFWDQQA